MLASKSWMALRAMKILKTLLQGLRGQDAFQASFQIPTLASDP